MASFHDNDAPMPRLSASSKSFFDDPFKPQSFGDMTEWNWMRDFLYNFGYLYKSQTLKAVEYPKAAVYGDRRVYAQYIAKAMNLIQEDYVDRMSMVGNQGRHVCEAFCGIFAPDSNEFPTSTLSNQIEHATTNRGDVVTDGAVACMHTLRKIGNTADHLHLAMTPADKPKVVDAVCALVKDVYAFFRRSYPEDTQRAAGWANKTSAVKIYLTSIHLGKYFSVFVRTGFGTMDGLLDLSNDLRRDAAAIEADLDALERNGVERGDRRTFKRELVKLTEAQAKAWETEAQRMKTERLEMERMEAERERLRREEEQKRRQEEAERERIRREEEQKRRQEEEERERIRREEEQKRRQEEAERERIRREEEQKPGLGEPLDDQALAAADPQMQKNMIGERLYPLIYVHQPQLAGKITGMLLEMDNAELLNLIESPEALMSLIDESLIVIVHRQQTADDN